ncbi:hypothetical protein NCAS_0I01730 [Naumovozyma castellii]|uniref:Probable quinone oxidoreductase n=1 Tax=Naumovozyma castellii TaxID=27288 RepID=G0VK07_NAUCA|nr:hypothetical protein NCAS_0I01730 [Naumovozyma castellii CBS 4309]CCC71841.1 hypothetical protein NCAS_0I01730 [Naumovozyma castellii CBS 4309]
MFRKSLGSILARRTMSNSIVSKQQSAIIFDGISDGYDVIKYKTIQTPTVENSNEMVIKNSYSGINFIEAYFRKGIYPCELPYLPGREASGIVAEVGKDVKNFQIGDKVAYLHGETMAEFTKIKETDPIIKLSKDASDENLKLYAAGLLQSLTAITLINEAHEVKKGEYVLVYAAAGGVGLLLDQLLKMKGAHTIAVCSTKEKLELAKANGAEFSINSKEENVVQRVMEITNNKGVDVAYDSIGKATFEDTLAALKLKGSLVSFGNASGPVPPLLINRLSPKNLKLVRPQLYGYITNPEDWEKYSKEFQSLVDSGKLNIKIFKTYPLKDYKIAVQELEGRKTTGKLVLKN